MFLNGERFAWDAPLYPSEFKIITRTSEENNKYRRKRTTKIKK